MPEKVFHLGTDHSDCREGWYCVELCREQWQRREDSAKSQPGQRNRDVQLAFTKQAEFFPK